MKLKTSFFNRTIFKKNLTRYWPLWGFYLLVELLVGPGMLFYSFYRTKFYGGDYPPQDHITSMRECCEITPAAVILFIFAGLIGMAVFGYLKRSRSANMLHAFPVDRNELFFTGVISGAAMLIAPQILSLLGCVLVCLLFGVAGFGCFFAFTLAKMIIALFVLSMITFCLMLTGQGLAGFFFMFVMNVLYETIGGMVNFFSVIFGKGLLLDTVSWDGSDSVLSPFHFVISNVSFLEENEAVKMSGLSVLIGCFAAALAFFAAAYLLYRKRQIEDTEKFIIVRPLRPVFRWGAGIVGGGDIALVVIGLLAFLNRSDSVIFCAVLFAGSCTVVFLGAQMLLQKTFRVFNRRFLIEAGAYIVFTFTVMLLIRAAANRVQNYIPDKEDIKCVYLTMEKTEKIEGDMIDTVIDLHRDILSHLDEYDSWLGAYGRGFYEYADTEVDMDEEWAQEYVDLQCRTVEISYYTKDGFVNRCYEGVPGKLLSDDVRQALIRHGNIPENFIGYLFGGTASKMDDYRLSFAGASLMFEGKDEKGEPEYRSLDLDYLSNKEAMLFGEELKKAIDADAREGTLQKYNVDRFLAERKEGAYFLNFTADAPTDKKWKKERDFLDLHTEELIFTNWYWNYSDPGGWLDMTLDEDCKNCMNVLRKYGMLDKLKKAENELQEDEE